MAGLPPLGPQLVIEHDPNPAVAQIEAEVEKANEPENVNEPPTELEPTDDGVVVIRQSLARARRAARGL